ncbi:hypothetical protein [Azovibrio restrictus]|jgi:hypothetical protein|uniref:hypothetical protein n=1 Tax=Azovibrio restrictus TaxID=146938 RepID=UPI0026EFB3B8|nr:hypothetical protein [Azovibrio restrictus]
MKRSFPLLGFLALALPLTGCDQLSSRMGLEDPAKKEARLDAEGRAVGSGCRHSGRAIEDCYSIYTWLPKESVFAGWREMDEYMRENKLETVAPQLPPPPPPETTKRKKKSNATPAAAETAAPSPDKPPEPASPPAAEQPAGAAGKT